MSVQTVINASGLKGASPSCSFGWYRTVEGGRWRGRAGEGGGGREKIRIEYIIFNLKQKTGQERKRDGRGGRERAGEGEMGWERGGDGG